MQNLFQMTNQRVIYFTVTTLVFLYKILLMKLQFRSVKESKDQSKGYLVYFLLGLKLNNKIIIIF